MSRCIWNAGVIIDIESILRGKYLFYETISSKTEIYKEI